MILNVSVVYNNGKDLIKYIFYLILKVNPVVMFSSTVETISNSFNGVDRLKQDIVQSLLINKVLLTYYVVAHLGPDQ